MGILRSSVKCGQALFTRRFSSNKPYQEISIPVPWGEIRGKWWGPTHIRPILAVHGWQDNCGTFDKLMPLLSDTNVGFLAMDVPGHGYSTRLPAGWPKLSLMGHSMGGRISYTYTMMYPQQVDLLICLDSLKPWVLNNNHTGVISEGIEKCFENNKFVVDAKEPPSYSIEEMKQKVHEPNDKSVDLESAQYIIQRGFAPSKVHPGKYYFTRDPRLKSGELNTFPLTELLRSAPDITCPLFVAKAKLASYYEPKEYFYQVLDVLKRSNRDLNFHHVEGTHHTHLNTPHELGELLRKFIQKYNLEDRSIGGLKQEMIVTEVQDSRLKESLLI